MDGGRDVVRALRYFFAGVGGLRYRQALLGHERSRITEIYTYKAWIKIKSLIDDLNI
jgi:hypothetical protein